MMSKIQKGLFYWYFAAVAGILKPLSVARIVTGVLRTCASMTWVCALPAADILRGGVEKLRG